MLYFPYFQKYSKLVLNFLEFFSMLSENRKLCHDLKLPMELGVKMNPIW